MSTNLDKITLELFYDSNLNQQSFSEWNYSQKIDAVKYMETLIRENARQGKRTDLERKASLGAEDETCVQGRHKLRESSKRTTARDKMARRLGISTATFSKYRRIIKLPDGLLQSMKRLLDEKRITFEAAYTISGKRDLDIRWLIEGMEQYPDRLLDLEKIERLPNRNTRKQGEISPVSKKQVLETLVHPPSSDDLPTVRKRDN